MSDRGNDLTASGAEAAVVSYLWAAKDSVERYEGLVQVESVTLTGTYPDTVIEVRWQQLRATQPDYVTERQQVWRRWVAAVEGGGSPREITLDVASLRPDLLAEDIIESIWLRATGD